MTIFICGDSTAASYPPESAPITGWGQVLGEFTGGVPVDNRAVAGRSSKSFLSEGRLQAIETVLSPGDLLLVQFAHNDESPLVWRHTDPWTSYYRCLEIFADTAMLHGARPVMMTPVCLRLWRDGKPAASHGDYPDAVRALAAQKNLPLVDLYAESLRAVREAGEEESKKYFLHIEKGVYPAYPEGREDDAHTRRAGAEVFARLTAEALRSLGLI